MSSPSDGAGTRSLLFLALSVVAGVLVAGIALPAVGLMGLTAKRGAETFQSLPTQLTVDPLKQRSRLLAADGTVIATFYSQNRVYVPMRKIATEMQDAIVATEDARFYEHNGIDLRGTVRAHDGVACYLDALLEARGRAQGRQGAGFRAGSPRNAGSGAPPAKVVRAQSPRWSSGNNSS